MILVSHFRDLYNYKYKSFLIKIEIFESIYLYQNK